MNKRRRCAKTTRQQYLIYLDELESNHSFRTNKFSSDNPDILDAAWKELTEKLNCSGGPRKSITAWKKVFADWKCCVKKKAKNLKLSQIGMGGEYPEKMLNDIETKLIDMIGEVVVYGFSEVAEMGFREASNDCAENKAFQNSIINCSSTSSNQSHAINADEIGNHIEKKQKIDIDKTKNSNTPLIGLISQLSDIMQSKSNWDNDININLKNINIHLEKLVNIEKQKLKLKMLKLQLKYPDVKIDIDSIN